MIIVSAISHVQRNLLALTMYVAGVLVFQLSQAWLSLWFFPERAEPGTPLTFTQQSFLLIAGLVGSALIAPLQAVVFARIGKEIDRPLWRCASDWQAVRRFFQLWFLLNLAGFAFSFFMILAHDRGMDTLTGLCLMLYMALFLVAVPLGACIMFSGALEWGELGRSLSPMVQQAPRMFALIALNLVQFLVVEYSSAVRPSFNEAPFQFWGVFIVVGVVSAYIDCVVFAGTWHLCIEHRNADQDVDFDF